MLSIRFEIRPLLLLKCSTKSIAYCLLLKNGHILQRKCSKLFRFNDTYFLAQRIMRRSVYIFICLETFLLVWGHKEYRIDRRNLSECPTNYFAIRRSAHQFTRSAISNYIKIVDPHFLWLWSCGMLSRAVKLSVDGHFWPFSSLTEVIKACLLFRTVGGRQADRPKSQNQTGRKKSCYFPRHWAIWIET